MGKKFTISNKEIIDVVNNDLEKRCMDIYKDIEKYSFSVISDFYLDYTPAIYKRKFGLPRLWTKPDIKRNKNKYSITFIFEAQNMSVKHSPEDIHNIWNGAFLQGYHGAPILTANGISNVITREQLTSFVPAPKFDPSPWERIRDYAVYKYNAKEK